jgi:hypothetical protein
MSRTSRMRHRGSVLRMYRRTIQLIVVGSLFLAVADPAWALFGVGDLVSDPPTETNTANTVGALGAANSTLAGIATSDSAIATSVTTPGGAGLFQGVAGFLDTLNANFGKTINAQVFNAIFPGWASLPLDAIPRDQAIATLSLATYQAAMQIAANQAADFDAEDSHFGKIEAANGASGAVLQAIQSNTEAILAAAQQTQMERQLLITLITVEATRSGEELNERAQQSATAAQVANQGILPQ